MKLPEVEGQHQPEFPVGSRVWVITGQNYYEDRILSILFELCHDGPGNLPVLICTGYRVRSFNFDSPNSSFRPNELYASEELARTLAKWHPVSGLTAAEWKLAIGDRADDASLEECELSRCCAIISDIRDLLLKCQKEGGLIERDVRRLRQLWSEHEHPRPNDGRPFNLDKIMEQLGLSGSIS